MRKNVPVQLTVYDEDDTAVYDGAHVMPWRWMASYDMKTGAQYKIIAKISFALAVAFHL
jgi:hypothetical protein